MQRFQHPFMAGLFCGTLFWAIVLERPGRGDDPEPGRLPTIAEASRRQSVAVALEEIDRLIVQLGSDRYIQRRLAQQRLREIGIEAFDRLHTASEHVDPEIAAAAGFLLREIEIPWTTSGDVPDAINVMSRYDVLPDEMRLRQIQRLTLLPRSDRLPVLCRIVRFDPSEAVSKTAAVAILAPRERRHVPTSDEADVIDRELGASTRIGAEWLHLYRIQAHDPSSTVKRWQQFVEAEARLLAGKSQEPTEDLPAFDDPDSSFGDPSVFAVSSHAKTTSSVVVSLTWHLLGLHQQLGHAEQAVATMARILDYQPDQFDATAVELIDWFAEVEAWDALDKLLAEHENRLASTRRAQYVAAVARKQQGRIDEAERLAARALEITPQLPAERIDDASKLLAGRQQWDWAKREYQRVIESEPAESKWSLLTQTWLAAMLFDLEENREAAAIIEGMEGRIEGDPGFRAAYMAALKDLGNASGDSLLSTPQRLTARRHFFLACDAHQNHDWESERSHLQESIRIDPTDADVLIAMYSVPGVDDAWREDVRRRIVELSRQFQRDIDENPSDPTGYNQWAWLISNTEGDFQKAIRYSHRSLELAGAHRRPASFLDTLGRCYFAAGDLQNALKYQREAVSRDPSMQVMQRQLALFEEALAQGGPSAE